MIKFTIIIGQKYFSNHVTQSNYLIIQTKLLTFFLRITLKQKFVVETCKASVETQKAITKQVCWKIEYCKTVRRENMLIKYKKLAWDW